MKPLIRRSREIGSIWLDGIHRGLLASGRLQGLTEKDGLASLTSIPARQCCVTKSTR